MTAEEIRAAMAVAEEQLKLAREAEDGLLVVWFTQEIRSLEAALDRRNGEGKKGKRQSQADILVEIVMDSGAQLFHTPDESFISCPVNEHIETFPVDSQATRQWLRRGFYLSTKKAPNNDALKSAIGLLQSFARFDGETLDVHLRTGWYDNALYYDLCDPEWRAVKIHRDGWEIVATPPVKFIRYSHMSRQTEPQGGGELEQLFDFINIRDRHGRELIKFLLPTALIPNIPRPCIAMHGDQGSGKTSTARRLRALIDPSNMMMLRCKDDAETVQGLAHHYCPVIDNVSNLPEWLSDTLSRAVTGEGFTKRALYTNSEDVLFHYKRVLILTGIGLVITKPDLLDRSIIIPLDRIPDASRRDEQALDEQFEMARPRLFGAILDALAGAIREYENVQATALPRMADFAKWSMAVALGQGCDPDKFIKHFATNVDRQNEEALAASVVATALLAFLTDKDRWSGQPHELYASLKEQADSMKIPGKSFPGSAAAMTRRLREIRPNLLALGWQLEFSKSGPRTVTIVKIASMSSNGVHSKANVDDKDGVDDVSHIVKGDPWDAEELA